MGDAARAGALERAHPMPEFDGKIHFDEGPHTYHDSRGIEYISTSALIGRFFETFDAGAVIARMMAGRNWPQSKYYGQTAAEIAAGWAANGAEASHLGTVMHETIERNLDGALSDDDVACLALDERTGQLVRPELAYYLRFRQQWLRPSGLLPWRVELRAFSRRYRLAGSIDGLFLNPATGAFVIVDWKRSKDLERDNRFRKRAKQPLHHMDGTKYSKYELQQNVYRWMLEHGHENGTDDGNDTAENEEGQEPLATSAAAPCMPCKPYRVEALYLCVLHPDNETYHVVQLSDRQREVEMMLDTL